MEFDTQQQEAIAICCDTGKRIVAVTGQAGTGKTTIIREVHRLLSEAGYSVVLCAPTGKAAKRIFEATGIQATTIHRLLEYTHPGDRDPKTGKCYGISFPRRDQSNPLTYDFVLADEYAMVNQEVHRNLINALGKGCIRAFGDVNQLPPIEKDDRNSLIPSAFTDLLTRFTSITLTTIHRQGEGSGIVSNGARINRGMSPARLPDFDLHITDEPVQRLEKVLRECRERVSFQLPENQVITPSNTTWVGTHKLNALMQNIYQDTVYDWTSVPRHDWDSKHPVRVAKGDKVIYGVNNYDLELFNGEAGVVVETTEIGEIVVDLGDREIVIPPLLNYVARDGSIREFDPRKDLYLAYAITTHKSQGSEYKNVIYVLNKSNQYIQLRSNFYTAVTRAREKVAVITDTKSLSVSVTRKIALARKAKQEIIA